ncbi:MAG: helix-turn-helix domain-containing protein [Pusillimonas sp.]
MNAPGVQVISTREAADRLGVSVRTVQLWVESGALDAWKTPGGHRRIPVDSVEAMLQQRNGVGTDESHNTRNPPGTEDNALRVLVVEDDPHLQEIYTLVINSLPFSVDLDTAGDGFGGLIKAGSKQPHVIIADLMLPGMDGFRMIRALLEMPETQATTIYVISALTSAEIEERGGLPQSVQAIVKPAPLALITRLLSDEYRKLSDPKNRTSEKTV